MFTSGRADKPATQAMSFAEEEVAGRGGVLKATGNALRAETL
jgi:hypothetical protein